MSWAEAGAEVRTHGKGRVKEVLPPGTGGEQGRQGAAQPDCAGEPCGVGDASARACLTAGELGQLWGLKVGVRPPLWGEVCTGWLWWPEDRPPKIHRYWLLEANAGAPRGGSGGPGRALCVEQSPSAVFGRVRSVTSFLAKTFELCVCSVSLAHRIFLPAPELGVPVGFHGEHESTIKTRLSELASHPFEARLTNRQGFHGPPATVPLPWSPCHGPPHVLAQAPTSDYPASPLLSKWIKQAILRIRQECVWLHVTKRQHLSADFSF